MAGEDVLREEQGPASVDSLDDVRRRKKLEELTRLHASYLRGLASRLCRGQLDPEDLVQDTFEKTMRTLDSIPAGANERAWLTRIMHNLFIDRLRRKATRREDPIERDPSPVRPEELVWWQALTEEAVRAQLAHLPEDQRRTFELFAFHGKSYDAIAAELRIAKATVGTRILRARQRLRELLTGEHDG